MRALWGLLGLPFFAITPAQAQQANVYCNITGTQWQPCNAGNPLAVSASVSASITGFNPTTTGTPISVTTGGVTGSLPVGAVVVASNVGTTNIAYCKLGASATVNDQPIAPNGGWFAFTVSGATQLTCITSTSTTTVNMVGGTGLPTGTGGGASGGGGGGAVTVASGADVAEGAIGDAAWSGLGNGTVVSILKNISAGVAGSIPAGANVIGHVIADSGSTTAVTQATAANLNATVVGAGSAGTANAGVMSVQGIASMTPVASNITQINGTTGLAGAGATGSGSQRITAAQDSTTIAGSNPGRTYNTIAASQTAQVLSATSGGGTGTTGDYLSHCVVIPTSTSPGVVTILDNATTIIAFPGGASSLSNLVPFTIPVGAISVSGAWKVTTGASLSVSCSGKFS